MKRRRSRQYEAEEAVALEDLLANEQTLQWNSSAVNQSDQEAFSTEGDYPEAYLDGYEEFYSGEYSEAHEAADSETRFHVAMGLFDLISILVGIVVILVLVGMLATLVNWLRTDILHSALLLQSGLQ